MISNIQDTLVIILYTCIAIQFARKSSIQSQAGRSFVLLVAIFLICSFNGYFMHMFRDFEEFQKFRLLTMVPLIGAALWYVWRGEVGHVADAIKRDDARFRDVIDKQTRVLRKKSNGTTEL